MNEYDMIWRSNSVFILEKNDTTNSDVWDRYGNPVSSDGAVDIIGAAARVFLADGDVIDVNNGGDNKGVHNSKGWVSRKVVICGGVPMSLAQTVTEPF